MRISSFELHRQASAQLQNLGAEVARTQQQIASGKRIVNPSDDPVGAARAIEINQELGARAQFLRNMDVADATLALEESVLNQITGVVHRVQELALQAGSGIQTVEDQKFLAAEIETRFAELLSLVNTRGADGQYIFAGFRTDTAPFLVNGDDVEYRGDSGQRHLHVDRGQTIALSDSGDELFMRVPSSRAHLSSESVFINPAQHDAVVSDLRVIDQELVDAFYPDKLVIEMRPLSEAGGSPSYTVTRASDGRPVDGLVNIPFGDGDVIAAMGASFRISGAPQVGDQFIVATNKHQGLLQTVRTLASELGTIDAGVSPDRFRGLIDSTIEGLDEGLGSVLRVRAEIGARLNTMTAVKDLHDDLSIQMRDVLSEIQDLDFAEAVSNLSYQSFVLEAAQQSFVRVNNLSLFNVL